MNASVHKSNTSVAAYRHLVSSGILGETQLKAWWFLASEGPCTGRELSRVAGKDGLWKRISELKSLGLAKETGVRQCRITGMNAIVWAATIPQGQLTRPDPKTERSSIYWLTVSGNRQVTAFDTAAEAMSFAKTEGDEILQVKVLKRFFP